MDITVKYTERAGHAFDIVNSELKPGDYDSIISVSGDGLIHETVNGLCTRPDWTTDLRETLTLGFIPGGTANGLVTAVLDHTGETSSVQIAAFIVAKGRRMEMDVTEIEAEYQERKIYSILSTAWAIIADCDINSEAIRCLGSPRFTIWGVMRVLFLRKYLGCVNFTGFPVEDKHQDLDFSKAREENRLGSYGLDKTWFLYFFVSNSPWIGAGMKYCPLSKLNDGYNDILYVTAEEGSRVSVGRTLVQGDAGDYFDSQGKLDAALGLNYIKSATWSVDPGLKAPPPEGFQWPAGRKSSDYSYSARAFFSIDGERYPSQRLSAKVVNGCLPIYY